MLRQAVDLAGAIGRTAAALAKGDAVRVDPDTAERRMELCQDCPARNGERCGLCTCVLAVKTVHAQSSCPVGVW